MMDETRPWAIKASCKGMDANIFFPETHTPKAAKQACAACPVNLECLIYAIEYEMHGVWGGTSHRNRDASMLPALYAQLESRDMHDVA